MRERERERESDEKEKLLGTSKRGSLVLNFKVIKQKNHLHLSVQKKIGIYTPK